MTNFLIDDAAKILSVLGPLLQETRGQNQSSTVCILATNSVESLLTIFAAILYNIPISIIHTDSESLAKLELLLQAANPFAILVADETLLKDVLLEKYTPHLRRILYTGAPLEGPIPLSISVGQWNTVINNAHLGTASTDIQLPDEQNFGAPVRVVYPNANGGAAVAEFFHHNIAAAIASNIKFLPKSHQWTPEDTVLLFASQFSVYTLVAQLSTLISHATLAFVDHESVLPSAVLESVKPTILINDNYSTLSLLNLSQSLTLGQEIRLALNRAALSRGSLNKTPVVEYFKSVRQIFSSTLVYPGQQEAIAASDNSKAIDDLLTCEDSNTIRALAGAHLFHALTTPLIASPISQTTIWDYRLETPDTFKGKPVISVNFGPVVSCIEARLVDAPAGQGSVDRYNYGLLQVRGCSSGNDIDIWVSTGINAVFTSDGCLRLMYEK